MCLLVAALQGAWILEQPRSSLLFRHPRMEELCSLTKAGKHALTFALHGAAEFQVFCHAFFAFGRYSESISGWRSSIAPQPSLPVFYQIGRKSGSSGKASWIKSENNSSNKSTLMFNLFAFTGIQ